MSNDTNLQFIREKIDQVRSAIMYSQSNELIRLPNSIVTAVKVDDEGQLWFTCDKPSYLPEQYSRSFPARLHFYRKGKLFHIEVSGAATIVNDVYNEGAAFDRLLIKMEMKNISYTETQEKIKSPVIEWMDKAYQLLFRHIRVPRNTEPFPGH